MTVLADPNSLDLEAINPMLESAEPEKIVQWAAAQFGRGLVMSSSFGAESALLIHMATRVMPNIRIIFIDTGYLFPETHQFMEQLRARFDLNVWIYRTRNDPIAYLHRAGEENPTWRKDIDRCCAENKNEPFERAMRELKPSGWLRGIRRNQADTRRSRQIVEWSQRYHCYAISPLLNWTGREIYAYMKRHDLPFHPLYDKGYASIGCNPLSCTRPVQPGEDPRSGRWSGTGKLECGINVDNSLDSANL
ncbi:phosphoadenylyl-sulfate reductase [Fontivita pretiosa]|uniref:phosphoadenylyl-sulfate reductase n=1 Tax=Fontivita pretiosa TaxID=2989684 RepID=UPI003D17C9EE